MSLATWKKEFYPVPASKVSKKNALAHSLKKWEGLLKNNLKKHGVESYRGCISEGYSFLDIDSSSCALCIHHDSDFPYCSGCPLHKSLGRACSTFSGAEYESFTSHGDAKPMFFALRRAVKEHT
jgi:hypothetical protein